MDEPKSQPISTWGPNMSLIHRSIYRHRRLRWLLILLLAGLTGAAHSQVIVVPEPPSLGVVSDRGGAGLSGISERVEDLRDRVGFERPFGLDLSSGQPLYVPGQTGGQFGDDVLINGLLAGALGSEQGPLHSQTLVGSLLRNQIVGGLVQGLLGGPANYPFGTNGLLGRAVNPAVAGLMQGARLARVLNSPVVVTPLGIVLETGLLGVEGPLGFEGTAGRLLSVEDGLLGAGVLGGNPFFYNMDERLAPGVLIGRNGDGTGGLLGYGSLLGTGLLAQRGLLGTGLLDGERLRALAERTDFPRPDFSDRPRLEFEFDRSFQDGVLNLRLGGRLENLRRR